MSIFIKEMAVKSAIIFREKKNLISLPVKNIHLRT